MANSTKIKLLVVVPGYQPFYTHTVEKHAYKNRALCLSLDPETESNQIVEYGHGDVNQTQDELYPYVLSFFTGESGHSSVNLLNKILVELKNDTTHADLYESSLKRWYNQNKNTILGVRYVVDEEGTKINELHTGTLVIQITEKQLYKIDKTWNKQIKHWASFSQWDEKGKERLWEEEEVVEEYPKKEYDDEGVEVWKCKVCDGWVEWDISCDCEEEDEEDVDLLM